jgi:hypothetical protein
LLDSLRGSLATGDSIRELNLYKPRGRAEVTTKSDNGPRFRSKPAEIANKSFAHRFNAEMGDAIGIASQTFSSTDAGFDSGFRKRNYEAPTVLPFSSSVLLLVILHIGGSP